MNVGTCVLELQDVHAYIKYCSHLKHSNILYSLPATLDLPSSAPYKCKTNSSKLCSPILILLYCMTLYLAKVRHHNNYGPNMLHMPT